MHKIYFEKCPKYWMRCNKGLTKLFSGIRKLIDQRATQADIFLGLWNRTVCRQTEGSPMSFYGFRPRLQIICQKVHGNSFYFHQYYQRSDQMLLFKGLIMSQFSLVALRSIKTNIKCKWSEQGTHNDKKSWTSLQFFVLFFSHKDI